MTKKHLLGGGWLGDAERFPKDRRKKNGQKDGKEMCCKEFME